LQSDFKANGEKTVVKVVIFSKIKEVLSIS